MTLLYILGLINIFGSGMVLAFSLTWFMKGKLLRSIINFIISIGILYAGLVGIGLFK
jgi:hypothetical protein